MNINLKRVTLIFGGVALIIGFQNCAKVGTNGISVSSVVSTSGVTGDQGQSTDGNNDNGNDGSSTTVTNGDNSPDLSQLQSQSIVVKKSKDLDVLIVVDNSLSMHEEQTNMANKISNFLSNVSTLNWRVAVTTTDPRSPENATQTSQPDKSVMDLSKLVDGQLIQMVGASGSYWLDSSKSTVSVASSILANTIYRPETGSGSEQGIYTTLRALQRVVAGEGVNKGFLRSGASLAVVVLSDENESQSRTTNQPGNLIAYINGNLSVQSFSFHSIVSQSGSDCAKKSGQVAGLAYETLSKLTSGIIGDICASDYTSQLSGIGAKAASATTHIMTLACQPNQADGIVIRSGGVVFSSPYSVDGVNLVFDSEIPEGTYSIEYKCVQ